VTRKTKGKSAFSIGLASADSSIRFHGLGVLAPAKPLAEALQAGANHFYYPFNTIREER
jgi:hypothetical protein